MYRLKEDTMAELEIKKSRFLCYLHKSFSEADAKEFITANQKASSKRKGITDYAFIIGEQNELQRSNDDGSRRGSRCPHVECLANRSDAGYRCGNRPLFWRY